MADWQPVTTNPPAAGHYEARIQMAEDRYLPTMVRYWDGQQWLSRKGKLPTGFGNWGDFSRQSWRPIPTGGGA
ncbi:hypothetical protein D9M72_287310 [compost metagenome]